mmetsp:Transcript_36739/g.44923  ORF Transcript_36739/g.44923 Transcript_36739/m.44923 type:complete len:120 (+) Transcript_36739:258-617(+)
MCYDSVNLATIKYGTAPAPQILRHYQFNGDRNPPQSSHGQHNKKSIKFHFSGCYMRQRRLRAVVRRQTCDNRRKYVALFVFLLQQAPSQHGINTSTPSSATATIWHQWNMAPTPASQVF